MIEVCQNYIFMDITAGVVENIFGFCGFLPMIERNPYGKKHNC